jgi:DNA adenine methylase
MVNRLIAPPLWPECIEPAVARRFVALMPPRVRTYCNPDENDRGYATYVEPYFAGGEILLANDPAGITEVVNIVDGDVLNFWQVVQDEATFRRLLHRLRMTPFSQAEWSEAARDPGDDPVEKAARYFVRNRQSRGGQMLEFATLTRSRTRNGMNEEVSSWWDGVEGLAAVHSRLKRVAIIHRDPLDVIRTEDGPRTFFFIDPPSLHETSVDPHERLVQLLAGIEGRFLLRRPHG